MYLKINNFVFNQDKIECIIFDSETYELFVCLNNDRLKFSIPYLVDLDADRQKKEFDFIHNFILDNIYLRSIEIDLYRGKLDAIRKQNYN